MATPRLGLVVEDKPTELSCPFWDSGVHNIMDTYNLHINYLYLYNRLKHPGCSRHSTWALRCQPFN